MDIGNRPVRVLARLLKITFQATRLAISGRLSLHVAAGAARMLAMEDGPDFEQAVEIVSLADENGFDPFDLWLVSEAYGVEGQGAVDKLREMHEIYRSDSAERLFR